MRTLTGKWYLKKMRFGGYRVWVEVMIRIRDKTGKFKGVMKYYEDAIPQDFIDLDIKMYK